jgi:hypothetical protein
VADASEHRRQKKIEKQKKVREAAARARRERVRPSTDPVAEAFRWPVAGCYASSHWHEQGALVSVALLRTHSSGKTAVLLVDCDLADRGVIAVDARLAKDPEQALTLVSTKSDHLHAMLETSPEQGARIVAEAEAWGRSRGHQPPPEMETLRPFLNGIDANAGAHGVLTGPPPPPPPEKKTLWSRLFGG